MSELQEKPFIPFIWLKRNLRIYGTDRWQINLANWQAQGESTDRLTGRSGSLTGRRGGVLVVLVSTQGPETLPQRTSSYQCQGNPQLSPTMPAIPSFLPKLPAIHACMPVISSCPAFRSLLPAWHTCLPYCQSFPSVCHSLLPAIPSCPACRSFLPTLPVVSSFLTSLPALLTDCHSFCPTVTTCPICLPACLSYCLLALLRIHYTIWFSFKLQWLPGFLPFSLSDTVYCTLAALGHFLLMGAYVCL